MKGNGFLLFALTVAAVFYGAYFSRGPLERWHKRLAQDLERMRTGAGRADGDGKVASRDPERQ